MIKRWGCVHFCFFVLAFFITNNANAQEFDSLLLASAIVVDDSTEIENDTDVIPATTTHAIISFLSEIDIPTQNNNKVKVLKDAVEKFNDLFEAIKNAKHHIHLEYFNFRNDSIGNALFDLLAARAQEGIQVRAVFDGFGNWSNNRPLTKKYLKELRKRGVEIVAFDDVKFPYINHVFHRDHRKIVVIDGIIGYTGGINVADYYIQGLPGIGPWHDTHVRIEGAAVQDLQEIFLRMWNKTTDQNISGDEYYPKIEQTNEGGKRVAIVDRTPRKTPELIRRTYAKAIALAQKKIQIVNPYFLPTSSIKRELRSALKRGVEVEIMFSPKADIKFTPEGSLYAANRLMKLGASIYLYDGGFHHSKIMMIDDELCTVGTANLDGRSLRYDYEVNAFIFDKEITAELKQFFESDKQNCEVLTPKKWKEFSKWKRMVGWMANIFTPFL